MYFPTALQQLFIGLYTMELFLIGLFLLVRSPEGRPVCLWQTLIMGVLALITAGFQYSSTGSFEALQKYVPVSLHEEFPVADTLRETRVDERVTKATSGLRERGHSGSYPRNPQEVALNLDAPVVWIPADSLSISDDEVYRIRRDHPNISTSNAGAGINERGKVVAETPPSREDLSK
jgi:hypothetical protein